MAYGDKTKTTSTITSTDPTVFEGCTDPTATNYNPDATKDDGSCTYASTSEGYGCTDPAATNYNKLATVDDGSCTYASTDELPIEGELTGTSPETIQEVREIVSDVFYKLWFVEHTLTDEQILSMQTTIRDGKKQTGRTEGEPLVFYKKDRNTLENRNDLQGHNFEQICQDIFDNEISTDNIPGKFTIYEPPEEPTNSPEEYIEPNHYWNLKKYIMRYTNEPSSYDVVIAEELIKYHDDLLPPDIDDTDATGNF